MNSKDHVIGDKLKQNKTNNNTIIRHVDISDPNIINQLTSMVKIKIQINDETILIPGPASPTRPPVIAYIDQKTGLVESKNCIELIPPKQYDSIKTLCLLRFHKPYKQIQTYILLKKDQFAIKRAHEFLHEIDLFKSWFNIPDISIEQKIKKFLLENETKNAILGN